MEEVEVEREAGVMTKDPGGHRRGARQGFCTDTVSVFLSSFMGCGEPTVGGENGKGTVVSRVAQGKRKEKEASPNNGGM